MAIDLAAIVAAVNQLIPLFAADYNGFEQAAQTQILQSATGLDYGPTTLPAGITTAPCSLTATASTNSQSSVKQLKLLHIPYDQVVTVSWNMSAHAITVPVGNSNIGCDTFIFGNPQGPTAAGESDGIAFHEAVQASAFQGMNSQSSTTVSLPAGTYIIAALAGATSYSQMSVAYHVNTQPFGSTPPASSFAIPTYVYALGAAAIGYFLFFRGA